MYEGARIFWVLALRLLRCAFTLHATILTKNTNVYVCHFPPSL
jgi:hypothetical protein